MAYEQCLSLKKKGTNFIGEFDLSGGKSLKEAFLGELKQSTEYLVAKD